MRTALEDSGNVWMVQGASMIQMFVMETHGGIQTLSVMMGQMSGTRPVRAGTALKDCGNVLIRSASPTQHCAMVGPTVLMGQMSGTQHVRTAQQTDHGDVPMVQSVSRTQGFVMEAQHVMMHQMSRLRPVRTGTALKAGGNVLTDYNVSQKDQCVMETHCGSLIVMMDPMSGKRHAGTGTALKPGLGNVQTT